MKILSIGGSNSQESINRQLANFTATLFKNAEVDNLDISSIKVPIYSIDTEKEMGLPEETYQIAKKMDDSDFIVLSLAEHNGSFCAGFKSIIDWVSRIENRPIFNNKPMLLMATSPGARGGASVLEHAHAIFPYRGADIKAIFSLPSFYENFDLQEGITNKELLADLQQIIAKIQK